MSFDEPAPADCCDSASTSFSSAETIVYARLGDMQAILKSELTWVFVTLVVSLAIALPLVFTIPPVSTLPEGTSSVLEYVATATVSRFGLPVAFFLMVSALTTAVAHNGGATPDHRVEFGAKLLNFGAALITFWGVAGAFYINEH